MAIIEQTIMNKNNNTEDKPNNNDIASPSNTISATTSTKKRKNHGDDSDGTIPPKVPDGWNRCQAYNERKRRFCRQSICPRVPNFATFGEEENTTMMKPIYCGNHYHLYQSPSNTSTTINDKTTNNDNKIQTGRKGIRIPCPLDQSHTIYESSLEKHLKICPVTKLKQEQECQVYYQRNVNMGGCGEIVCSGKKKKKDYDVEWVERLVWRILASYYTLFGDDFSENKPMTKEFLQKITYQQLYNSIPTIDYSQQQTQQKKQQQENDNNNIVTSNVLSKYKIKIGGVKHLSQVQSLASHILQANDSETKSTTVLEMGAGRGMLGLIVSSLFSAKLNQSSASSSSLDKKNKNVHLMMVERAGSRAKADTILRQAQKKNKYHEENETMDFKNVKLTRIKCDLAHVYLPSAFTSCSPSSKPTSSLSENNEKNNNNDDDKSSIIVIAKHLCGAGTDLALKSLKPLITTSSYTSSAITSIAMSTCCHGICSYQEYVGRDYLKQILTNLTIKEEDETEEFEFGQVEFDLMKRWSAGSTTTHHLKDILEETLSPLEQTDEVSSTIITTKTKHDVDETQYGNQDSIESNDDNVDEHTTTTTKDESGDPHSITSIVNSLNLSCGAKGLGRACQRLIDYGRKCYIENDLFDEDEAKKNCNVCGNECDLNEDEQENENRECSGEKRVMRVDLFHYVDEETTPQNTLLFAYKVEEE